MDTKLPLMYQLRERPANRKEGGLGVYLRGLQVGDKLYVALDAYKCPSIRSAICYAKRKFGRRYIYRTNEGGLVITRTE
jgi:hypothetical protein